MIDFITNLPNDQSFNAIFMCVEKLTKLVCLTPCQMGEGVLSAEATTRLFYDSIVWLYGVPTTVLHDWDVRFTS